MTFTATAHPHTQCIIQSYMDRKLETHPKQRHFSFLPASPTHTPTYFNLIFTAPFPNYKGSCSYLLGSW